MEKRNPRDLDFFEHMLIASEMCEIHAEYSQKIINLAVKHNIDEMSLYKLANHVLIESEEDPEFIDAVLPILIKTAKEDDEE